MIDKYKKRFNADLCDSVMLNLPKTDGEVRISIERLAPVMPNDNRDLRVLVLSMEDKDWTEDFYNNMEIEFI